MNLACWITATRFILAPLIFWQLSTKSPAGVKWALILLIFSGCSDVLDGWVARARNEITELGKALDPVGDKLVIFFFLLGLTWWELPAWMVLIYLVKELFQVLAGVFLLKKMKHLIPANYWGKSSTVVFFIGFIIFFLNHQAGLIAIVIAVLLSIYALYTYYRAYLKLRS